MRIEIERLILRNWREEDRTVFHRLNADEKVMAFFPWRQSREEAGRFFDRNCDSLRNTRFGFYALEDKQTRTVIGMAGLLQTDLNFCFATFPDVKPAPAFVENALKPSTPKNTVEIGWRLLPEYWGHGFATEAARALLAHGFHTMKLDEIVSFAVQDNLRSIAIMRRIGMIAEPEHDFDHPRVPDSMPHLKRHVFFRIKRQPEKQSNQVGA